MSYLTSTMMKGWKRLGGLALVLVAHHCHARPNIVLLEDKLVFKEATMAPDNFRQTGITINDQFPGPTLTAYSGACYMIEVVNKMDRDLVVHWHGVDLDDTPCHNIRGVTPDNPPVIKPGSYHRYTLQTGDQAGTFWYHAQTGVDSEFAYGALVIKDDKDTVRKLAKMNPKWQQYDENDDLVMLLSEQWHRDSPTILQGLTQPPFRTMGAPASILVNGQGAGSWGWGKDNSTVPFNRGEYSYSVKPKKTYRMRIIGANGHSLMRVMIPYHPMTIVEVDGTFVTPKTVDHVDIDGGQRVSVLIRTDQEVAAYPIYIKAQARGLNSLAATAYLNYEGEYEQKSGTWSLAIGDIPDTPPTPAHQLRSFDAYYETFKVKRDATLYEYYKSGSNDFYYPIPTRVDREIILNVSQKTINGMAKFLFNGEFMPEYLPDLRDATVKSKLNRLPNVHRVMQGDTVQIVFQLNSAAGHQCSHKPWHIHGHSFYVVGSGTGTYTPGGFGDLNRELIEKNQLNSVLVDTFTQYPILSEGSQPVDGVTNCGWYAIRFPAMKPGLFSIESQMTAYRIRGLQAILQVIKRPNF